MKKITLSLLLSAAFLLPLPTLADTGTIELPGRENRGTGRTGRPNNSGKPDKPNRPSKPNKPDKPHGTNNSGHVKPAHHPGNVHTGRPRGNSYRPNTRRPGSVPPPGYRPYRPNPQYYPSLRRMLNGVIGTGRLINVWQFAPDAYMARYYLNGRYWMQRFYPGVGRYDAPFVVYRNGDRWYDDYDYQYYDDGNVLRVFINGVAQNPWTLIPSFQLNINL